MPLPMVSATHDAEMPQMIAEYPVATKHSAGLVDGIQTEIMSFSFSDKIMITISQDGKLAQWVQVRMDNTSLNRAENFLRSNSDDMLPMAHLTAKTLLGGSTPERENVGQLYATQIASAIASKNPDEGRTVLVGFGLNKSQASREQFFDLFDLVTQVL